MKHVVLQPVGAQVTDLSLKGVDADTVDQLVQLLAEHGVLIMPGQEIDDSSFVDFLRQFGELMFSVGETPVDDFPDLNVISNVGRTTPPRSTFHVDTSYVRRPPAYTALRAVTIPERGGETLFTNQYRAYETLPAAVQDSLVGKNITHVVTGLALGPDEEKVAVHPLLRKHPVSGRTSLYLSTPQRCAAVSGLSGDDGRTLIKTVFAHSTAADNIYRHSWAPGDVVMWDNACVLHQADHSQVIGDRIMHRGMVAGRDAPRAAWV